MPLRSATSGQFEKGIVNDLTGRRFTRWTVLSYAGRGTNDRFRWLCRCDCGTERTVAQKGLLTPTRGSQSCGCLKLEKVSSRIPPTDRFNELWMPVTETGCYLWIGSVGKKGYGQFGLGNDGSRNRVVRAHRFSYELKYGPVPIGLELDHNCRVRSCVNPDHLEPVTHVENLRRSRAYRRSAYV